MGSFRLNIEVYHYPDLFIRDKSVLSRVCDICVLPPVAKSTEC